MKPEPGTYQTTFRVEKWDEERPKLMPSFIEGIHDQCL